MLRWIALSLLIASPVLAAPLRFDPNTSRLSFVARQAVLGETVGRFDRVSAPVLELDLENIENSRIRVVVETKSVFTGNGDRDKHLRNEDFFDVERYPQMVFESTAVSGSKDRILIRGKLTVKETQAPLELPLELRWEEVDGRRAVHATGEAEVSRKALGLNYDTPFYIPEIGDTIVIRVDVVGWVTTSES